MRVLSIRQPWAWLIVHGFKDVENRTWNTGVRGEILIHAGKAFDKDGYLWVKQEFPQIPLPAPAEFDLGGIVGRVSLVDCVPPDADLAGLVESPWYTGDYGFLLAAPSRLPFRSMKGRLGFFDFAFDLKEAA